MGETGELTEATVQAIKEAAAESVGLRAAESGAAALEGEAVATEQLVADAEGRYALRMAEEERLGGACFAAGVPLLTPYGSKKIECFQVGDEVLSRSEYDPEGPLEVKVVEEVFKRLAPLWQVRVDGRSIGTTAEHPFWVLGKGWTPARFLACGDGLASHDGEWVTVEDVRETQEVLVVYNLRVADFHTYFVGCDDWGFAVWCITPTRLDWALNSFKTFIPS